MRRARRRSPERSSRLAGISTRVGALYHRFKGWISRRRTAGRPSRSLVGVRHEQRAFRPRFSFPFPFAAALSRGFHFFGAEAVLRFRWRMCAVAAMLLPPVASSQFSPECVEPRVYIGDAGSPGCGEPEPVPGAYPGERGLVGTSRPLWRWPESSARDPRRASYPVDAGWVRVVPTVIYVPDPAAQIPGVVSIGVERAAEGDPWRARGELAWSGRPRASFDLDYRVAERQAYFRAEDRPAGVVALPNSRVPGSSWDGAWAERIAAGTTATLAISGDRLELDARDPQAATGRLSVHHRASDAVSVFFSVSTSSYVDEETADTRLGVATVGTVLRAGPLGVEVKYRDESNSLTSAWGHGGRLTLRAQQAGWRASAYADAQQQAATLPLNASSSAVRAPAMTELGLVGGSPESVVRLFRDRGLVFARGGVDLGALRIDPLRMQGGLDLAWRDEGSQQMEVALQLAVDHLQGTDAPRRALLGQLQMSWRVLRETNLSASYANWSLQGDPTLDDSRTLFRISLRSRL